MGDTVTDTAGSALPEIGEDWYYAFIGQRTGPVNGGEIHDLIRAGTIGRSTLVWRAGLPEWQEAQHTDMGALFALLDSGPPPLPGRHLNDALAWLVACLPLTTMILLYGLAPMMSLDRHSLLLLSWFVPLLANWGLCYEDSKRLKAEGHDMDTLSGAAGCFLVPVYLFMRADRLRQSNAYAWAWLACFGLAVLIAGVR